jgi:hypothetical protein
MKPIDMTNKKYGNLTAKFRVENNKCGKAMWSCICDCGKFVVCNTADLRRGKVVSCGCARKRHGMSKTKFHNIWLSMRDRCNNPNGDFYYCYGGRGIGYDKSWDVFENFYNDMYSSYDEGLSIERIDVNKGYSKENCKWIPLKLQARNTRKSSSNTVGIGGISEKIVSGERYLNARITDKNGKRLGKMMNVRKHGYEKCLLVLSEWLEMKKVEEGYGVNHGK